MSIDFTLDGRALQAFEGETIFRAAEGHGVTIPHLCCRGERQVCVSGRAGVEVVRSERTPA